MTIADVLLGQLARDTQGRLTAADAVTHPIERGRAREVVLTDFLRAVVPPGYEVDTGFVIDSVGGQSRQQDIVIRHRHYHPVFSIGGAKFFPVEGVVATVEVKSSLTKTALADALQNGKSVKALDRTGEGTNNLLVGGRRGEPVDPEQHEHQVFTVVLAGAMSRKVETAAMQIWHYLASNPRRVWPNMMGVVGNCVIGYTDPGELGCDPMSATGLLTLWSTEDETEPLIMIAHKLLSLLRVAPIVDYWPNRYVSSPMRGRPTAFPVDFPAPGVGS